MTLIESVIARAIDFDQQSFEGNPGLQTHFKGKLQVSGDD